MLSVLLAVPIVYSLLLLSWYLLRHHLVKHSGLPDLLFLEKSRKDNQKIDGTAVICARVCHDHFKRVLVIESEAWLSRKKVSN
ncbi:hypothetical protein B0H10DRAFT_1051238 [Mycena sp. CBHHK59/15]|nr:hypothetical protein B0H10DRAFT_1051238 [Mycena sp. CBHHK59/15]